MVEKRVGSGIIAWKTKTEQHHPTLTEKTDAMFTSALIVLVVAAVLAGLIFSIVSRRPAEFRITRSATMAAPAAAVFAHVNDFHRWQAWSPWERLDPAMQRTFAGAASGTGAIYAWNGNKKAGAGRLTITESRAGELIGMNLEFIRPFPATNQVKFSFEPANGQTRVTWTMTGVNDNFIFKLMTVVVSMDKMVGGDFERGLAQLKALVES